MKKCYITVLFISILAFALTGFTSALAAEKLAKKQVLTIAFDAGDSKSLDPHRAATTVDRSTVDPIFNGLVRYSPGNQVKPEPDLAESWSVSAKPGKSLLKYSRTLTASALITLQLVNTWHRRLIICR